MGYVCILGTKKTELVSCKGRRAGAEVVYSSFDCNLFFDTEQDVNIEIVDPSGVVADAMKDERVKIVFLHRAKGCSFGLTLWQGFSCVEVDVRGVGSSTTLSLD